MRLEKCHADQETLFFDPLYVELRSDSRSFPPSSRSCKTRRKRPNKDTLAFLLRIFWGSFTSVGSSCHSRPPSAVENFLYLVQKLTFVEEAKSTETMSILGLAGEQVAPGVRVRHLPSLHLGRVREPDAARGALAQDLDGRFGHVFSLQGVTPDPQILNKLLSLVSHPNDVEVVLHGGVDGVRTQAGEADAGDVILCWMACAPEEEACNTLSPPKKIHNYKSQ